MAQDCPPFAGPPRRCNFSARRLLTTHPPSPTHPFVSLFHLTRGTKWAVGGGSGRPGPLLAGSGRYGSFVERFALPDDADVEGIQAEYERGVLHRPVLPCVCAPKHMSIICAPKHMPSVPSPVMPCLFFLALLVSARFVFAGIQYW